MALVRRVAAHLEADHNDECNQFKSDDDLTKIDQDKVDTYADTLRLIAVPGNNLILADDRAAIQATAQLLQIRIMVLREDPEPNEVYPLGSAESDYEITITLNSRSNSDYKPTIPAAAQQQDDSQLDYNLGDYFS